MLSGFAEAHLRHDDPLEGTVCMLYPLPDVPRDDVAVGLVTADGERYRYFLQRLGVGLRRDGGAGPVYEAPEPIRDSLPINS